MSKKELRARRRKKNYPVRENCPTPRKTAFASETEAIMNMIRHGYRGGGSSGQGVYECTCGYVHRTSRPGNGLVREFSPTG